MWTSPSFEILVETLTGSIFEVSCKTTDTIGYIKSRIQKYEGLYNLNLIILCSSFFLTFVIHFFLLRHFNFLIKIVFCYLWMSLLDFERHQWRGIVYGWLVSSRNPKIAYNAKKINYFFVWLSCLMFHEIDFLKIEFN